MQIDVAYKFRIYPNQTQQILLAKTFGCCRFLWNQMLVERTKVYAKLKDDKEALHSYRYKTEKQYKAEFGFLKDPNAKALQNVTRTLFQAFHHFFEKRAHHPRFKSRKARQSYTTNNINNNIKIDFNSKKLKLPKLTAWVTYRDDRVFAEPIRKVTVSKTKSGKYFVSLSVKREVQIEPKTEIEEQNTAAFDMSFAAVLVSESTHLENPRFYRTHVKKLKKLHRELSRKQPVSKNRTKARLKLARCYDHINNARTDWLHKQSSILTRAHDAITLEDLHVEGMKRFTTGFAKTVTLDFSWGEFTRMLAYKMAQRGNHLVFVDQFYPSSKLCSVCGYKNDALKLSDREWTCPDCGTTHERDENAAKNIAVEGRRILQTERKITIRNSSTVGTT